MGHKRIDISHMSRTNNMMGHKRIDISHMSRTNNMMGYKRIDISHMSHADNMGDIKEYISYICPIRANGEVNQKSVGGKFFLDISVQGNIIVIENKILFTEIR